MCWYLYNADDRWVPCQSFPFLFCSRVFSRCFSYSFCLKLFPTVFLSHFWQHNISICDGIYIMTMTCERILILLLFATFETLFCFFCDAMQSGNYVYNKFWYKKEVVKDKSIWFKKILVWFPHFDGSPVIGKKLKAMFPAV